MVRIQEILNDAEATLGTKIVKYEKSSGGINSSLLKARNADHEKFAIKIYPYPTRTDKRDRIGNEAKFYTHLEKRNIRNTPKLLFFNKELQYSVLTWIDGKPVKKLNDENIVEIASFIKQINKPYNQDISLPPASDAVGNIATLIKSIENRLDKISSKSAKNKLEESIQHWIKRFLSPYTKNTIEKLWQEAEQPWWTEEKMNTYASPSDVGIHNTFLLNHKLYFLDFEYAGMDDLSKLVADWVLQPNYIFKANQESLLINQLLNNFKDHSDYWLMRYKSIKALCVAKWLMIMLRQYSNCKIREQQWCKIKEYAKHFSV